MEISNLFVCLMGMGVTFFGLTCLIGLITLLGKFARSSTPAPAPAQSVIPPAADAIPNRQELIAAVSAVLAEELGTDVTAIRILSFKKIS